MPKQTSPLRRLIPYLIPYKWSLALAALLLLLSIPCTLFHPLVWKYAVDVIIAEPRPDLLLPAIVVMIAVHVVGMLFGAFRSYILGKVGQQFIFDLRNAVYKKIQSQSLNYFRNQRQGDLISRSVNDIDALRDVVINGVDNIIANLFSFIFVAGIIVSLHVTIGLITLIPIVMVGFIIYFFNARVKGLYKRIRELLGEITIKLQENISGMHVIKSFARDHYEEKRFEEQSKAYRDENVKVVVAQTTYSNSVMFVGFFSNVSMVGLGTYFVLQGSFTLGGLMAYRGYWWQLFSPIHTIAQINEMFQRASAAAARVFELLDEPVDIVDEDDAKVIEHIDGHIAFNNVSFSYGSDKNVLEHINATVPAGQSLGIVGPSGAGKSTLLNMLLRFYDPSAGSVSIDGTDLKTMQQISLRSHCALVSQEAFLFNDSIINNMRYGRFDATEEEVYEAARLANAHEFILQCSNGYDTTLGERGVKLSGGERQRLCIARAFLANPRILLLDEATSAVEPESEHLIQVALKRLMEGRSCIFVSHRLSMVRDCDQIIVIKDKGILERGSHDELMQQAGWYAEMYDLQMGTNDGQIAQ